MSRRLETGVDILDRKLNGGVPPGCAVAITAPPASQSELFLYEVASRRPTLYLTTVRPRFAVERSLASVWPDNEAEVVALDASTSPGEVLELVEQLPERANLVVDPVRMLERQNGADYRQFLHGLRTRLIDRESTAFLHCLDGRAVPPQRDLTEYVADVVFELSTERNGDNIENHLGIPKFRGGRPPDNVIKLDLSAGVEVDISRNIV